MKKIVLFLIFLFSFVSSQEIVVDERINDIYFANGILTTKKQAWDSSELIEKVTLQDIYQGDETAMLKEISYKLLYNQTYGFYADTFEMFNQKKAEHKYFWITAEAIISIVGKTTKISVITDVAKDELIDMIAKEISNALLDAALTAALDNVDLGGYKSTIDTIKEALHKNAGAYTWNMINAISDILKEIDLKEQFNALTKSISSGHQAVILAHSQGNFFVNELESKFDANNKAWMKQYIKAIAISTPANKVAFDGSYITYDNDPTIIWPNRVGKNTSNPLRYRRFYLQYGYNETLSDEMVASLIDEVKAMNMPEECSVAINFYFKDDISSSCYNNASIAVFDITRSKFHTLEYYMQKQLVSSVGTVRENPSREVIINFIKNSITSFRTAPSQWKFKKKKSNCSAGCSDKKREVEHKYSKEINDMALASLFKAYSFSEDGKLYLPGNWYAGDIIVSSGVDYVKASSIEGEVITMGSELESNGICYELRTVENNSPAKLLDTIGKEETKEPATPTSGYVEVSVAWENSDIDVDLKVGFPGEHDVKDECRLFEHFYSPDINYKNVGEGLYPVYVTYGADSFVASNESLMEMQNIVVTIKVPGSTEARTVNLKLLDSLAAGHIADIRVEEAKVEVVLTDDFQKNSTVLYYHQESGFGYGGAGGGGGSGGIGGGGMGGGGGGSGSWTYNYTPPPSGKDYIYSIIWHISQALLGPLSGANISIYALGDYNLTTNKGSNPIHTNVSSYGSSIHTAGVIAMPREIIDSLADNELYIVEARGGLDVDVGDDGVFDTAPTVNVGAVRALTSGSAIKNIGVKINILTEMAYQISKKYYDENDLSRLMNKSDEVIKCVYNEDTNLDGAINTVDALYFTPYENKYDTYHSYNNEFMPIIRKLQSNKDIYEDSFKLYAKPLVKGGYFSVNEGVPVGTVIGKIETDCVSESPVHTFRLSGTGAENFEIDGEGNLKPAKQLIYEENRIYNLQVIGTNAYGDSPSANVYITVTADNTPIITSVLMTYVIENMPDGTSIGDIFINDMGYTLTGVRLEGYGAEYFTVDNSGNVKVAQGGKIDVKDKVYNLRVIASNVFGDSASSPITINIYDDVPVITSNVIVTVKDNISAGTVIGKFSYYPGLSEVKEFKLEGFGVENFNIDKTGIIKISENANLSVKDSPYYLRVTASNDHGNSSVQYASIEVISSVVVVNHDITLQPFYANIYAQTKNGSGVGGIVYRWSGYIPPTSFSLSGEGSERFSISDGGYITLIDNTSLSVGQVFNLEANASNEYVSSDKTQVRITVIDDYLSLSGLYISIIEGIDAGTAIGKVGYWYGVNPPTSFELSGDDASEFSIDENGTIRVKNVFDYDVKQEYHFDVTAVSNWGRSAAAGVTVNIIDDAPVLRDTVFNVMENSYGGEALGYVTVSSSGKSKILSFTLTGEGAEDFSINEQGFIRTVIGVDIDYEKRAVYHLKATASNSHDTSNEANITINVINAPDQEPVLIPTELHVDENSPAGTVIGNMSVYSDGIDGIISFAIEGVDSDWFDIDDTGRITVGENAVLDYESKSVFKLKAKAANSYGQSALTDLTISLNDLPDTPPTIRSAAFYINENLPENSFVGQLQVYGAGAPITSVKLSGDGSENFKVYNNGTIVVADGADLDYEKKTRYDFTATVSNEFFTGGGLQVIIIIYNLPDTPPVLNDMHYSIYKETPQGMVIGSIKAASSIHCDIQGYRISDESVFGIRDNGEIYTKVVTSETNYTIDVYALSGCGNSNTAKLTIDSKNKVIGQIATSVAYNVAISSDETKAFVADYSGGLKIIDVSDSAHPTIIGQIAMSVVYDVVLSSDNTKAFVTDYSIGLKIIDVNDPTHPVLIGQIATSRAYDVALSSDNTKAFVADLYGGLKIIDVNDPTKPTLIGQIATSYAYGVTLSSDNTKAFVADGSDGLKIIDISDPVHPVLIGQIATSYAYDVVLSSDNTKAFVADDYNGLKIIDVSDPVHPVLIGQIATSRAYDVALSSDNTKAFVADLYGGLKIIDVSDSAHPTIIGQIATSYAYGVTLSSDNTKAFVADGSDGLKIVDIENISKSPIVFSAVFTIDENSSANTFAGELKIKDYNSPVTSVVLSGNGAEKFRAHSNGTVVVVEGADFDHESKSVYTIYAVAYNEFGAGNNASITININDISDIPPVVQSLTFYVDENSPAGTFAGQLGIDDDGSPVTSIVLSGDGAENFKAYNNGTIVVAEGANLDYESKKSYTLYAVAYNEFGESNSAKLSAVVNNIPDRSPIVYYFYQHNYVDENSPAGTFAGQLGIDDDGSPVTSIVLSGDGAENFKVYNNGTIVVAEGANLDYEKRSFYTIYITAYNEFGSSNIPYAYVRINDLRDTAPVLQDINISINKLTPADKTIGTVSVISNMHCNITGYVSDDNSIFSIRDNGEIYVKSSISWGDYIINVYALSGCGNSNTAKLTIDSKNKIVSQIATSYAYDVVLSSDNTKAFVADDYNGLKIIDVSDPVHPTIIGQIATSRAYDVALSSDNTKAFVADLYGGLKIIDVNDPTHPTLIGQIATSYAYDIALSLDNTKAFIAAGSYGLNVIDVSDPTHPTLIGQIATSHAYGVTLSSDNTKAFVADGGDGLKIIDISDPVHPTIIGQIDTSISQIATSHAYDVALSSDNTKAFVVNGGGGGLKIIDVNDPTHPTLIGEFALFHTYDVALSSDNTKAFMADSYNGLKIIDVSDPTHPTIIGQIATQYAQSVTLSSDNTKAFVADYSGGLKIIDIEDISKSPVVFSTVFDINENSLGGSFVGQLNINDYNSPLTSIFLSGDGAENFKAYNNGTIVVAEGANLDYESRKSYALHVRAYNEFGASNNASIKMNINDLPDTPPVFLSFTQYFYVYEYSQSEAVVGKLIINNVFSPITSIVLSGDGAENFKVYNNGTIVVADGANINYKNKDFYSLSAVAHNEYGESNVGYIAIFVNDIPNPNISSGYLNINENSPSGTFVGKLSISDYDNLITYIYFEGDGSEDFDVALDGTITVANGAVLDYETRSYYNLRVFAENKYGESGSANIDISLRNIPDSPPFVSGTIIELDKNAQDGDEIGYAYISSDGSGVDNMHLSGEGSENFDLVYNDCNYGCSAYIVVAEGANLEYFDESMHKIYISASNEFGSGDAIIWLAAGKGSEVSPPEFNNITFVTFGSSIEEGDDVGIISPSSKIHCEITEYFTDNDKFAFIQRYEYIEIIANEFIQSGEVYNVNMYANSTCGVSNDIVVTIDTKNRLTTFDIYDEHHYGSLSLIDNETKLFVGGNYETDFTYVVDLKNSENSRSVDLKIGEGEEALLSAASKDGRYLYVIACEYDTNCALNVYDMSSPYNPALLGQLDMDAAYTINEYNPKIVLSKDGSKLFLQGTNIVVMVDISDPYLPVELSRIGLDYEYAMGMLISSDEKIIYITTYNNFGSIILARYDISSLHNPVKLAPISFYGEYAIIGMSDDNAFAYVSGEHGLVTYDISDTNNPIPINLYSGLQESYHAFYINTPVTLNDNKLLVSDKIENPFTIFDFSNPKKPYISVTSAYSSYFYLRSDLTVTTNKSKVFAVNSNIFMIDIEGIGK